MDAGRKTKYEERYCEMVIEHRAKGFSFESFAGVIGVNRDTLYEWCKVHKAFSDAKKIGHEKCLLFWENKGIMGVDNAKNFSAPTWIFTMKNRFSDQWKDKTESEISGTPIQIKIDKDDLEL